jgi:hypothetical protein
MRSPRAIGPLVAARGAAIVSERFWSHVDRRGPDDCWLWKGARFSSGYGRVRMGGGTITAHRLGWVLAHGDIPVDIQVCHRCDNPPCCNPAHLFAATCRDNIADCITKGRRADHRGVKHPCAKLTEADVLEIRRRWEAREPLAAIAPDFGITRAMVSIIGLRRAWTHL